MDIARYITRFLLGFIFIYAGIEKLFIPYNPSVFKPGVAMTDPKFFVFFGLMYFLRVGPEKKMMEPLLGKNIYPISRGQEGFFQKFNNTSNYMQCS